MKYFHHCHSTPWDVHKCKQDQDLACWLCKWHQLGMYQLLWGACCTEMGLRLWRERWRKVLSVVWSSSKTGGCLSAQALRDELEQLFILQGTMFILAPLVHADSSSSEGCGSTTLNLPLGAECNRTAAPKRDGHHCASWVVHPTLWLEKT